MDDKIIATVCLCDDLLKAMHHQENRQCQMNDAAILTTAFTAALGLRGNHESARALLQQHGDIPDMLRKSRFHRRRHRMKAICLAVFDLLAQTWNTLNTAAIYLIDSLPIAVCDHMRIRRSKLYSGEDFRGYQASKKRYLYGLKMHRWAPKRDSLLNVSCPLEALVLWMPCSIMPMRFPMGRLCMLIKPTTTMRAKICCKSSSTCTCCPYASRTRKERCHLLSRLSKVIIVKEWKQQGA